ncbi:MAG: hypothetical protein ABEK12_02730, partial [Candidatus Nanohaloarchaea archaeon]
EGGGEPVSLENTAGPVHARLDMKTPVPVYTGKPLTVPLVVENVGDGTVSGTVDLSVSAQLPGTFSCPDTTVALFDGSGRVTCTLTPSLAGSRSQGFVRFTLSYTYEETARTTVTVEGAG